MLFRSGAAVSLLLGLLLALWGRRSRRPRGAREPARDAEAATAPAPAPEQGVERERVTPVSGKHPAEVNER